jgi:hypothetical protein
VKDDICNGAQPLCPSAQPEWREASLIGIVGGHSGQSADGAHREPTAVSKEILDLSHPVTPAEVFRFAAPCICNGCVHFTDQKCQLAARVVQLLPEVVERLPTCAIRSRCRWWLQEGKAASMRCSQVVTDNCNPSEIMRQAATPAELCR